MPYTVTRQCQWPEGTPVVEVSAGGIDYTNPDTLVEKYQGEFETYDDPREAVKVAIAICQAWRKDGQKRAKVGIGATLGMTMPFETCSYDAARKWAEKKHQELPKCDWCGELLPEHSYHLPDNDGCFCSEYCAEEEYEKEKADLQHLRAEARA